MSASPTDMLIEKLFREERKKGADPVEAELIVAKRLGLPTQRIFQGVMRIDSSLVAFSSKSAVIE